MSNQFSLATEKCSGFYLRKTNFISCDGEQEYDGFGYYVQDWDCFFDFGLYYPNDLVKATQFIEFSYERYVGMKQYNPGSDIMKQIVKDPNQHVIFAKSMIARDMFIHGLVYQDCEFISFTDV